MLASQALGWCLSRRADYCQIARVYAGRVRVFGRPALVFG